MIKRVLRKALSEFYKYPYIFKINKFSKLGFSKSLVTKLNSKKSNSYGQIKLFDKKITYTNSFWFLQNIEELFIDSIYKFKADLNNPIIIDCGSNIGLSVVYFKQLYPNCIIEAFEPDPQIFKLMFENLEGFNFQNVIIKNKAIWINNEELLFSSTGALGGNLLTGGSESQETVKVKCERLKSIIEKYELVDFLKIDIEGAEYEVIKDCKDVLTKVKHLFLEYHSTLKTPQNLHNILEILINAGFRYYIKEAWENRTHPFTEKRNSVYDLQLNIFCYRI